MGSHLREFFSPLEVEERCVLAGLRCRHIAALFDPPGSTISL